MVDGPNENVNVNENNNDVNINPADNVIENQQQEPVAGGNNDNNDQGGDQQGADDHQDNAFADLSIPMASNQEELTEERKQQRIKFLEDTLATLKKQKSSLTEDKQDRLKLITQYENELLALRPMDEFVLESNKRAADARKRAEEKERLKREQEEINQRVADVLNNDNVADQPQNNVQPQQRAPRPLDDLFDNDDDEAEFDPFAAHENPQVVLQMPVVNAEHQNEPQNEVVENNPQQENPPQENPPRELTEEERQRRAADDARMAQIAENFRKNMADIDAEEAAEKKARKEAKRLEKEKPVAPIHPQETNEFFGMLDNIGEAFEVANADIEKEKEIEKSSVRTNVYRDAIKSYRDMYKVDVDENEFAATVTEAFDMIKSDDVATSKKGQQMLKDYYKGVLKKAYDAEKATSYADHRIPDFVDVGRSTNNLLRAAMYSYTDVYHNNESGRWFDKTANGGLDAKELTELTQGDSLWSMDQKSDEAWEKQSRAAKDLANEWLKEDRPYEKMINELNTLAEQGRKTGMVGALETMNKLMAAEWMLTNNPKMMVDDPEDPYNTIPNWGNKYWKAISATRDALGISKHTSMRDLVQNDYAAAARAVNSAEYNKVQFEDHVFERNVREIYDSKELQAKQFAIQSAAAHLNEEESKIKINELTKIDENKVQISVRECDEKVLWESQPKSSFIDKLLIDKPKETEKESKDKDKEKDKGNAPNL